jgi:peptidoglycan/xylan/chitin deacetylase (PgdA/CDA1 family)
VSPPATATVCLTFDVDAEAGLAANTGPERLTSHSERRFGITRGLPRILDLLAGLEARATFYVPGMTAERHPAAIRELVARGHEVGHHGHDHLAEHELTDEEAHAEIELGLRALGAVGVAPKGYRSPSWELTEATLAVLLDRGFAYDSSCMGDDRPYLEGPPGRQILELPVHWSLDDWPFFGAGPARPAGTVQPWLDTWQQELDQAAEEARLVTLTMHPEIVGRGYRFRALAGWLSELRAGGVRFATHAEVAAELS